MTVRQSVSSREYVRVSVAATEAGTTVDPTADVVSMAFVVANAAPLSGDFQSATWETDTSRGTPTYYARCLVGPGGVVTLTIGLYDVWVKFTDNPEVPVRRAPGRLVIF